MTLRFPSLHTAEASLVLEARPGGSPLWRHLGARVEVEGLFPLAESRTPASFSLDLDVPAALVPPAGLGWFGPPVLSLRRGGEPCIAILYDVAIAVEAEALRIVSRDRVAGVEFEQRILAREGFVLSASLRNLGDGPLEVIALASALLPLPAALDRIVSWRGRHNAELVECVEPMPQQAWLREARRGISGHGGPPGLFLLAEGATRHSGLCIALQLAWSGDSRIAVERDDEGMWHLSAVAALQQGDVVLGPGESWAAPDAMLAVSTGGRNGATAQFHAMIRARMDWPDDKMRPRPVHLNSWEACYFDHDADRIVALAEAAASVGAERFILDDGWFRGRNDDTAGLGDWTADPVKYPQGLGDLARRVTALGMEFGLWVEPEMVNSDSDLYRAHPEWALHLPGRAQPTARNQLVLDMRRAEVRDYLFAAIDRLLADLPIAYLKWDHNRDLAPVGGAAQVRGTYELLARLRAAHPAVEIESCAGGGGRSDAGIAAFTHRFWTSDNIDAVSRVAMQRGFLSFLPPEVMGSHVGASPAHATGRVQAMGFRAAVAMPGHFGVELDPRALADADRAELFEWIGFHRQWRHLLHAGQTWLGEGADGLVWQAQGSSGEFLLFVTRVAPPLDRRTQPLPLPFVGDAGAVDLRLLRIAGGAHGHAAHSAPLFDAMSQGGARFAASWLARAGLPLPPLKGESVLIFHGLRRPD